MSQRAFALTAGVIFLIIAFGHWMRVALRISLVVEGAVFPQWPSAVIGIVFGYLAWTGLRSALRRGNP